MKIAAVIAEFNPLHKGHVLPLQKAREIVGADGAVVCIKSSNVVQRGDFAIFPKEIRTQATLLAGADLIIELPAVYVLSSAQYFAEGAVALMKAMGMTENHLVFGSESGEIDMLTQAATVLDKPETQENIRMGLKQGLSYGMACQNAIASAGEVGETLKTANNLLGIAYLRAISSLGVDITAHTIKRAGAGHDAKAPEKNYASATYLREGILLGKPEWQYMPSATATLLQKAMAAEIKPASMMQIETIILALLRQARECEGSFLDDSEGLAEKIIQSAEQAGSLEELFALVKTKRYHLSRIRRMVLGMCLGFTKEDRPQNPPYIRVLGANSKGQKLLAEMREAAKLPIISRPGQVKQLGSDALRMFLLESKVTDLRALCALHAEKRRGGTEWLGKPIFVRE